MFERFRKWMNKQTTYPILPTGRRPITEGKTRGNIKPDIKVPPQRPKGGPPAPTPKFERKKPNDMIECKWIEVYKSPEGVEHHDDVMFKVYSNGNLIVYRPSENPIVYREYRKYIVHRPVNWPRR